MTFIQQFFTKVLPKAWAEDMRAESLTWMMRCPCTNERSIWESGGVRWKAKGTSRRYSFCPKCEKHTWHTIYRKQVL